MKEVSVELAWGGFEDWHRCGGNQKKLGQEKPSRRRPRGRHPCSLLTEPGGNESDGAGWI